MSPRIAIAPLSALYLFASDAVAELPIAIDGFRDPIYGAAVAVQMVQVDADGKNNELDAAYAAKGTEHLHLLLTGNLEPDFSRLEIFIDSTGDGQNQILGNVNPDNDRWATRFNLFKFDPEFTADFLIIVRHGTPAAGGHLLEIDFAEIGGEGAKVGSFEYRPEQSTGPFSSDNGILLGFDNSNTAGVSVGTGAADAAAAAAVRTGVELRIPLALIAPDGQPLRVSTFLNNPDHIYLYNQFLGAMPPGTSALGSDGAGTFFGGGAASLFLVDLGEFEGEQFFEVLPFTQKPAITGFAVDRLAGSASLTWKSSIDAFYTVEQFTEQNGWLEVTDGVPSEGISTAFTHQPAPLGERTLLYRIIEEE